MRASLLGDRACEAGGDRLQRQGSNGPDRAAGRAWRLLAERAAVRRGGRAPRIPAQSWSRLEAGLEIGLGGVRPGSSPGCPRSRGCGARTGPACRLVALDLVGRHALARRRVDDPRMLDVDRVSGENPGELAGRELARARGLCTRSAAARLLGQLPDGASAAASASARPSFGRARWVGHGSAWARLRIVGARSMLATGRGPSARAGRRPGSARRLDHQRQVQRLLVREHLALLDAVLAVELPVVRDEDEHGAAEQARVLDAPCRPGRRPGRRPSWRRARSASAGGLVHLRGGSSLGAELRKGGLSRMSRSLNEGGRRKGRVLEELPRRVAPGSARGRSFRTDPSAPRCGARARRAAGRRDRLGRPVSDQLDRLLVGHAAWRSPRAVSPRWATSRSRRGRSRSTWCPPRKLYHWSQPGGTRDGGSANFW